MNRNEYYKSKHWRDFRDSLLDKPDCECELCHRKRWKIISKGRNKGKMRMLWRGAVHHKHYNSLYKEKRSDVLVLCYSCHQLAHSILRLTSDAPFIVALQTVTREYFEYANNVSM